MLSESVPLPPVPPIWIDPLLESVPPFTERRLPVELAPNPMRVLEAITVPPLVITKLLKEPSLPTLSSAELLHRELIPVTRTLLFEELVA